MPADYKKYAWDEAVKLGVDPTIFTDTLQCESSFDPNATGDHGTSIGIAQIHLPAHADITREEASDGVWSIIWAAQQFSLGRAKAWTCYRNLLSSGNV